METNKKELRQKYKALRQNLSESEREEMSLAIANSILTLPVWGKNYFHVFLPIVEKNEIDTELILHLLSGKDKDIVISKCDFESCQLVHYLLTDNTKIKKNEYNIPEPVEGIEVPTNKIEVVFVPLLAFDKKGHRVGYGKGFYDKFLADCQPNVIKIGLSFFEPEELIADTYEDDVLLDYCVTPNKIYEF